MKFFDIYRWKQISKHTFFLICLYQNPTGHYAAIQYENGDFYGYNVSPKTSEREKLDKLNFLPLDTDSESEGYVSKVLISIHPKE